MDEDDYVVGPGDSFTFSVNGQDAVGAPVVVGADGRITLPDAGLLLIAGKTLRAARSGMMTALEISF
ncbi:MAG: polysaccharide biosynthesis/export family protein, partial [Proteobacteria bacterium]|nr:polysaccharide biosynthesis/export family protein [Pseudomonadota bacterium]